MKKFMYALGITFALSLVSADADAQSNRGWAKKSKGAVIGGAVGAGTGAAVNKKNRSKGAVIGGVVGAGSGYIIGRKKDKKTGRSIN